MLDCDRSCSGATRLSKLRHTFMTRQRTEAGFLMS
jgi:hypothetical protein